MKKLSDFICRHGTGIWLAATIALVSVKHADAQQVWAATDTNGNVVGFWNNAPPSPVPANCCTIMWMTDTRIQLYLNPTPTPEQAYATALAAGLTITSASTPALNGVYSIGPVAQLNITSIASSIGAGQGFPNGGTIIQWLDAQSVAHEMTPTQFLAFADAVRNYVYQLQLTASTLVSGGAATWPAATATIP